MRPFSVCVFCSAVAVTDPHILAEAKAFAEGVAKRGWRLVYGGGASGLMGHFADRALAAGGDVLGIIPVCLHDRIEVAHRGLTRLDVVEDLFARKLQMIKESDVFVVFPGGLGTLDEALEILTWKGLGQIQHPLIFANLDGFWESTLAVFAELGRKGLVRAEAASHFAIETDAAGCLARIDSSVNAAP